MSLYNASVAEQVAYAPFFGFMGAAAAQVFAVFGASYATAKASTGICTAGVLRPALLIRSMVPVIMAGIIGVYGLVISVVLTNVIKSSSDGYTLFLGFAHLSAGLTCGLCGLGAGHAVGVVGDAGVRATAQEPRMFVGTIMILIFAEVLGLYGLIVALLLATK